ncbi:MAG: hypothetical protein KF712_09735 [Akkermansiaceae bacterium]|nr:hypothetical protein [Akkermansiaceae bacterium]
MLATVQLEPDRIWQKGEPRVKSKPDGRLNESSGVNFVVSDADFRDFDVQLRDAIGFINGNRRCLELIREFPSVDWFALDFGIELRDAAIHSDILTPEFLLAAASIGISVEFSHYPHHPDAE